jgi:mono/diheme cytochrome c family protein
MGQAGLARAIAIVIVVLLVPSAGVGSAQPAAPPSTLMPDWDVFARNGCARCHRVRGIGDGTIGPDLGRIGSGTGFIDIAAAMWNHVPEMRARMREYDVPWPRFTPQEFSNLVQFLFTAQARDIARDPVKGQRFFVSRACDRCHTSDAAGAPRAPGLGELRGATSSAVMAAAMWNHVTQMEDALGAAGVSRAAMARTEAQDIAAYIGSTDGYADRQEPPPAGVPDRGQRLFEARGCAGCHAVGTEPSAGLKIRAGTPRASVTELPAVMWNHREAVRGRPTPRLTGQDMADITSYLHAAYYFDPPPGDRRRGRLRLEDKGCLGCHTLYNKGGRGAPDLATANVVASKLGQLTAMWNHARIMDNAARRRGMTLQRLSVQDLSDITTYLAGLGSGPRPR